MSDFDYAHCSCQKIPEQDFLQERKTILSKLQGHQIDFNEALGFLRTLKKVQIAYHKMKLS